MNKSSTHLPKVPVRDDLNRLLDDLVREKGGKKFEHADKIFRVGVKRLGLKIPAEARS